MHKIISFITAVIIASTPQPHKEVESEYIGTFIATEYCKCCNTPEGSTATSSGRFVPNYSVATSELPLGTIIEVQGKKYRVDDTGCPKGRIDFLKGSYGECLCNRCEKIKVYKCK